MEFAPEGAVRAEGGLKRYVRARMPCSRGALERQDPLSYWNERRMDAFSSKCIGPSGLKALKMTRDVDVHTEMIVTNKCL
jgi:hypothetical protein